MVSKSTPPQSLLPALSNQRLDQIACHLWEIYYGVQSQLSTDDDCAYTRGATFFGRARNRLITIAQDQVDYPWLKLTHSGMDVVCEIEGLPFRFFRDDHLNPVKKGFWRRNESDQLWEPSDMAPVMFRFVVEAPITDEDELEIYFIGYNALEESVCEWRYTNVSVIADVMNNQPQPIVQSAPVISPNLPEQSSDKKDGTS